MLTAETMRSRPEVSPGAPGSSLIFFVGLQLMIAAGLGHGYVTALTDLRDEPNALVSNFHDYPTYTAIGVVLLVSGILVTGVCGAGILMRRAWAPVLYGTWLALAVLVNFSHPHRLYLFKFPLVIYPLIVAWIYLRIGAFNRSAATFQGEAPGHVRLWLTGAAVVAMLAAAFGSPGNFAFAAMTWAYGLLRRDKLGLAVTLVSTLALASSIANFVGLAHQAFAAPA